MWTLGALVSHSLQAARLWRVHPFTEYASESRHLPEMPCLPRRRSRLPPSFWRQVCDFSADLRYTAQQRTLGHPRAVVWSGAAQHALPEVFSSQGSFMLPLAPHRATWDCAKQKRTWSERSARHLRCDAVRLTCLRRRTLYLKPVPLSSRRCPFSSTARSRSSSCSVRSSYSAGKEWTPAATAFLFPSSSHHANPPCSRAAGPPFRPATVSA